MSELERALKLLWLLADSDPCWFDHNGDCQAHGWFGLSEDEPCPVEDAKRLLTARGIVLNVPDWPGLIGDSQ